MTPEPFEVAEVQLVLIVNATRTADADTPKNAPAEWVLSDIAEALAAIGITEVDVMEQNVKFLP